MPSRMVESTWDFGHALALIDDTEYEDPGGGDQEEEEATDVKRGALGDFGKLFELLDHPGLPPETSETTSEEYTSAVEEQKVPQLLLDLSSDQSDASERLAHTVQLFGAARSASTGGATTAGVPSAQPVEDVTTKTQRRKAKKRAQFEQKALAKNYISDTDEPTQVANAAITPLRRPLSFPSVPQSAPPKPRTTLFPSAIQGPRNQTKTQALISDFYGTGMLQIEQRPQTLDPFQRDTPTQVEGPVPILNHAFLAAYGFNFGIDRHILLASRIRQRFPQDQYWLLAPMQLTIPMNGIHVFVDASNIIIGFYHEVKRLLGYPKGLRNEDLHISFDSLALLMERRRPVSKRVLVGSKPELPAFETARKIGYETHILDRVLKIRELTERQKYFQQQDLRTKPRRRPIAYGISSDSPFETYAEPKAPQLPQQEEKWVEQGVDELLHLKMVQSLLDASDEPGTIVLATGDAAEAEYSDGFKENVERALKKGWKVELYSWAKNISNEYRKPSFTNMWRPGQFQIFELDEFARDLLEC
ncbi:uncharacterized protein BDZ99DRAFT_429198 [Mytilinidion resinicola]|uniref:NYN domain-containing protein n=1 Tax=Mytilinidion resinicola TaxID=574789 RepID=A0A6A6Y0A3_9PEZI|nr:uncharacterized protein BDZ99DRAFT_429198 [Mytilinidion resinicola]KAF2801978.1 hypothetical protein BDZ99DRAFT_429198 [Mytilinidion resinicola]